MKLLDCIKNAKNVLIVGHVRPDGDCFGSGLAMKRILENNGAQVDFVVDSALPEQYSFMKDFDSVNNAKLTSYDLAISVDCADELRLGSYYATFKACKNSINIDHHATNTKFGKYNFVEDVSSTCELIYYLLKDDNVFDDMIAESLYTGLSTDTGHFKHNNTTKNTFAMAGDLITYNFNPQYVHDKLYRNNTIKRTKLVAKALNNIRFYKDNRIAIITITSQMLKDCGCVMSDTEGIIDFGMGIGCVDVTVCMTQQAQHSYKVSFRSKNVNVAEAAMVFGGGGHVLASGCVVNGYYEDCISKILKSITDGMED
jgi:phosphoesterase RecJ-like protein